MVQRALRVIRDSTTNMPPVNQIETRASLLGRSTPFAESGSEAFGSSVGRSIQQLGGAGEQAASAGMRIANTQKNLEADRFSNEAMTQLRDYYSPWMANVENNSKETFAEDFKGLADKSLEEWEAKAPNKEAAAKFRDQFQRFSSQYYAAASHTSAQTKMSNMLQSYENLNNSVIENYTSNRMVKNLDANSMAFSEVDDRFADLDGSSLATVAPAQVKKLKGQLVEDAVYAMMDYSPSSARKMLEKGTGLMEEQRIHAIKKQIDVSEDASRSTDRATLGRIVKSKMLGAENGIKQDKLDIKTVSLYLPDDKAQSYVTEVNASIDALNKSIDLVSEAQPWNPQEKMKVLSDLKKKIGQNPETTIEDDITYTATAKRLLAQIEEAEKDPAGALMKYNPAANSLARQIGELQEQDRKTEAEVPNVLIKQKQGELSTLMLHLQSQPAKDATESQKKHHTVVNRAALMVMSKAQAEANVKAINESSPQEAVGVIQNAVASHPGHENIAFDNLTKNGLDLGYWGAYKNQDNPNIADMVGALQAMKTLRETNPQRAVEIDKVLDPDQNQRWKAFLQIFPNDNYQRQDITAGMRRAVVAYAQALTQDGLSPELAVDKSVNEWIYKEMVLVNPNGQPLLMDRKMDGKQPMSDDEAQMFSRNLGELQKMVDPKQIDGLAKHFPSIWGKNGLGTEEEKWNQTKGAIANLGFFKPAGEYSTLYMRSDTGRPFELRRGGKAIAVRNADVPSFVSMMEFPGEEYAYEIRTTPKAGDIFEKGEKVVPTTGLSARETGFTGMANLFNPMSPGNIVNRIYGNRGIGATGESYIKQTTPEIISTNWPVEPKYFQDK